MASFWIHNNSGEENTGIGQINAAYVVNNNGIMTFYTEEGREVVWYVLLPGEMMTVDWGDD